MPDLIISGGMVADGSGAGLRRADVGISNGKIESIGDLSAADSERLDATGTVVSPGFIDIHSHSDFTLLVDPRGQSQISQGVTTEVIGNCGHGCAPITDPRLFTGNIYGHIDRAEIGWEIDWHTTAEFLERMAAAGPAVNVATLVPNGNLRIAHVADHSRPASSDEIAAMDAGLREGMEAGAFGLSTGLEYPPERNAGDIEIETLCRTVAEYGGIYAPHTRNREVAAIEAVDEVLRNARNSGVALHISHLSPRRGGPPDAREQILELVARAAAAGEDVTFDTHTRLHGITNLSNAVPSEHFTGDAAGLLEVLADSASRRAFAKDENIITSFGLGGWENVVIFNAPMSPDLEGRSITEIAGGKNPFDVIFDVLAQHAGDPHSILVTCKSYEDAEVIDTARQPLCMVGSDATALCNDGPLAGKVFLGAYTWAGWYLRQTVREFGVFTVEEAVRRMTAMPADRVGLGLRGRLIVGAPADIAVFDPDSIADQGTLEQPNRLAKGIRHTIVNGVPAFVDGSFTETRNGQILRRAG